MDVLACLAFQRGASVHFLAGNVVQRLAILRQIVHRPTGQTAAARTAHPHRIRVLLAQIVQTDDNRHRSAVAAAAGQIRFRPRPPAAAGRRLLRRRPTGQRIAGSQMATGRRSDGRRRRLNHIERTVLFCGGQRKRAGILLLTRGHVGRMRQAGTGAAAAVRFDARVGAGVRLDVIVIAGRSRCGGGR